jgi:hypothetical protein
MGIRITSQPSVTGETKRRKRRLLSGLSYGVLVSLIGIIGFALPETVFAGDVELSPTITVLVVNYSKASPTTLARAEREAGRIFRKAGLRVVWIECPRGPSTARSPEACGKEPAATDIWLRILAAAVGDYSKDNVFGFTVRPTLASVYYEDAVRLASTGNRDFEASTILGCGMAHEIGHLLLDSNGHSDDGIMQPHWDPEQIRLLLTGALLFAPEQSRLMRAEARRRMDGFRALAVVEYGTCTLFSRNGLLTSTTILSGYNRHEICLNCL